MGISIVTMVGVVVSAWALLSLMGSERQREMTRVENEIKKEADDAADAQPTHSPVPVPASVKRIPAMPNGSKPPAANQPNAKPAAPGPAGARPPTGKPAAGKPATGSKRQAA